ncbi:MAG: STAS domain-containing protein [Planctomycetes bacterium]|nr:STAS domain-containing protein [Planctomycetota bacterium]
MRSATDSVTEVVLSGRLDLDGVQAVQDRFTFAIAPRGVPALVDLAGVEFLASLGIGMFVSVAHALKAHKAPLVLFGARPMVHKTLTAAGVHNVLVLAGTRDEAMQRLA